MIIKQQENSKTDPHSAIIIPVRKKSYLSHAKACGPQSIEWLPHSLIDQEKDTIMFQLRANKQIKTKALTGWQKTKPTCT